MPQLRILLLYASHLRSNSKEEARPYVEVFQGQRRLARSRTADRSEHPAWNEALDVEVDTTDVLQLTVYDLRFLHRNEMLGTGMLLLDRLCRGRHVVETVTLLHGHGTVKLKLLPGEGFPERKSILSLDSGDNSCSSHHSPVDHSPEDSSESSLKHSQPPRAPAEQGKASPSQSSRLEWSGDPRAGLWVPPPGLSRGYTLDGMPYDINRQPECAAVSIILAQGGALRCRPGALISQSTATAHLHVHSSASQAGEGFQQDILSANAGPVEVLLSPWKCGSVALLHLDGRGHWFVDCKAYLACTRHIVIDCKSSYASRDPLFGFIGMRVSGVGTTFLAALGAIHCMELHAGEALAVGADHLFAYDSQLEGRFDPQGLRAGEPLVHFEGPAKVFVQTKSAVEFGRFCRSLDRG